MKYNENVSIERKEYKIKIESIIKERVFYKNKCIV
jgi:hypothetical protein